jgi:hypothetical protein
VNKAALMALGILMLTISGVGILYAQWSLSHITTGHITITEPPEPDPTGNFTIPTNITFPSADPGETSTTTVTVTSTLNEDVTITAAGGAGDITITMPPTTLHAGESIDVTLTAHVSPAADPGQYTPPIQFTVTQ